MRQIVVVATLACAVLFSGTVAQAAPDDLTPEKVRSAITRGQTWLVSRQNDDGTFPTRILGHTTGATSLALLALLNSGMKPTAAPIRKGLKYLRKIELPNQTYDVSLMLMVFAAANDKGDQFRMGDLVKLLERGQFKTGDSEGGWDYSCDGKGLTRGSPDRSNSQFAVLALRDAAKAGVTVKRSTWLHIKKYWESGSVRGGGWGYTTKSSPPRGSMTVAGIAALVITDRMLQDKPDVDANGKPICCTTTEPNKYVEAGIAWLGRHIKASGIGFNPGSGSNVLYYLYGLERAGRLSARRFFGDNVDWYREGAKYLVKYQSVRDGHWIGKGHGESDPVVGTSMALLFLSKGLAPVLINKLKYGPAKLTNRDDVAGNNWNQHEDDVRNLTDYISGRENWPQLLTWQTVEMRKMINHGGAEESLDQAKVLYIAGKDSPKELYSDPRQAKILRAYIDRGGFIFASANCDRSGSFTRDFKRLVDEMFKENGKINKQIEIKRLPEDHPVYRSEHFLKDSYKDIELYGVDYGCRTAIIFAPVRTDGFELSCLWSKWRAQGLNGTPETARNWINLSMKVGENVLAYATGREPPEKLRPKDPTDKKGRNPIDRGFLQVAKIVHSGEWNVAPRALNNLLRALNVVNGPTAATKKQWDLNPADKNLFRYPVLYMHGRSGFKLTEKARKQMQTYLKSSGGLLFADACCGSPQFDKSFRDMMAELFPDKPLKRIPVTHELFTNKTAYDISKVTLRRPESTNINTKLKTDAKKVPPYLEGIEVDGRLVVIYSKYDISCALENQGALSCSGYIREDAIRIGINILLYAMLQDVRYAELLE